MSSAKCIDEKGDFKACPYRIVTEEHKAMMRGQGNILSLNYFIHVSASIVPAITLGFV